MPGHPALVPTAGDRNRTGSGIRRAPHPTIDRDDAAAAI
jgi:hypothetical protein